MSITTTERLKQTIMTQKEMIREHLKEAAKAKPEASTREASEYRVTENTYISYIVIDVSEGEVVIESKDNFSLPNIAVGAATG